MYQEMKNCKKCGMLFTPSSNNFEYCPEHERKRRSFWTRTIFGGVAAGVAALVIAILTGGRGGGNSKA